MVARSYQHELLPQPEGSGKPIMGNLWLAPLGGSSHLAAEPRNKKPALPSLKLTWHLKRDGWNTSFLLGWPIFGGYVSFRECTFHYTSLY